MVLIMFYIFLEDETKTSSIQSSDSSLNPTVSTPHPSISPPNPTPVATHSAIPNYIFKLMQYLSGQQSQV